MRNLARRQAIHIRLRDARAGLAQRLAQPAHHRRDVGELACLDNIEHPNVPPNGLFFLENAILLARELHVHLTLIACCSTLSHDPPLRENQG